MKSRMAILLFDWLAAICLVSGCAQERNNSASLASCCAPNLEPSDSFTEKSIYQIDATWTADNGQPIKLGALQGRTQVVAMFFAHCEYACPIIVNDMKRIEAALPETVRPRVGFTLASFDTERDTPDVLRAYRQRNMLDQARWTLLRAEADDVLELAALLGVKYKKDARGQFAHSNLITVLNPKGEIVYQQVGLNPDIEETVKTVQRTAEQ
jgi:protein SCO1